MPKSRREFLTHSSLSVLAIAASPLADTKLNAQQPDQSPTPGAPPAFGTSAAVGPEVSATTFAEAEKLVQIEMTAVDRATAASNWRMQMAPVYELRVGPRKLTLDANLAPATLWNPRLPGMKKEPSANRFVRSARTTDPLPAKDDDVAFATVTQLSRWIESRQLTAERLANIYWRDWSASIPDFAA